jgi:hypothetical protein
MLAQQRGRTVFRARRGAIAGRIEPRQCAKALDRFVKRGQMRL